MRTGIAVMVLFLVTPGGVLAEDWEETVVAAPEYSNVDAHRSGRAYMREISDDEMTRTFLGEVPGSYVLPSSSETQETVYTYTIED